jgi:hypothetical protein
VIRRTALACSKVLADPPGRSEILRAQTGQVPRSLCGAAEVYGQAIFALLVEGNLATIREYHVTSNRAGY